MQIREMYSCKAHPFANARRSMALPNAKLNEDCETKACNIGHFINHWKSPHWKKRHVFRIIVSHWPASSASQDVVSNAPAATNQASY